MNGYQYIESFFKAILTQSVQIQGRLICLPKGNELNMDDFGQVLSLASKDQKYPLAAWSPPRSSGIFGKDNEWEDYQFEMFFLNTTYYTGLNKVSSKNSDTQTSSRPIVAEWEDMKLAATDFLRVLQTVQSGNNNTSTNMLNNLFRLHNRKKFIDPVSIVTTHRLSGVRLSFEASVFTTCLIQDYVEGGIVVLPDSDSCTFDADLVVVRNEVIAILEELNVSAGSFNYVIDGGGAVITTGFKSVVEWGFNALITGWTILADQEGDIVVDVWKDSYGNYEPTVADTIAGTEKPTLAASKKNQDLTLTTFATTVTAGDIWAFNVDSVSAVKKVTIAFRFKKQ